MAHRCRSSPFSPLGAARSPVFSHLSATLAGLSTVRAFGAQARFTQAFDAYQDGHTRAWFLFLATTRWFGVQLDAFSVAFIAGVSFSSILVSGCEWYRGRCRSALVAAALSRPRRSFAVELLPSQREAWRRSG